MLSKSGSEQAFARASRHLVGGVNSPARSFAGVGGEPLFMARGQGCWLEDVDGNHYVDFVGAFGPLILGHMHPQVQGALEETMRDGTAFGAPSPLETSLAEVVRDRVPGLERVRLVNSGTEATMSALRLARGYTGRDRVLKFAGCYHGHADSFLVQAGSGAATLGVPNSPGVPEELAGLTLTAPFNDLQAVEELLREWGPETAAVIVEPVPGNMGVVPPQEGFLQGLRDLASQYGALLIFDEVMTGFRVSRGGAAALYGVQPDLYCLGKVIGGGLPVGAFGGNAGIMSYLAPEGPIYHAGTLSGNPLAMAAGMATLEALDHPPAYQALESKGSQLEQAIEEAASRNGVALQVNRVGSMFTVFFSGEQVSDFPTAKASRAQEYSRFFWELLERGVFLPPAQFEAAFISLAHHDAALEQTVEAMDAALASVARAFGEG